MTQSFQNFEKRSGWCFDAFQQLESSIGLKMSIIITRHHIIKRVCIQSLHQLRVLSILFCLAPYLFSDQITFTDRDICGDAHMLQKDRLSTRRESGYVILLPRSILA